MKTLIFENDVVRRSALQRILRPYGTPHIAVNGKVTFEAARIAPKAREAYGPTCHNITMSEMDWRRTDLRRTCLFVTKTNTRQR
jgi:hypothetical protein